MRGGRCAGRRQAGLTLLELLIGIVLTAMLSAGLYYMLAGQQRTYMGQLSVLHAQSSLWQAMEHLQRELRRAGYGLGGCAGKLHSWNGAVVIQEALVIRNAYNLLTAAADTSDSFQILSATDPSADQVSVRAVAPWNPAAAIIKVDSDGNGAFANGDFFTVYQPGSSGGCVLLQATQNLTPPPLNLHHNPSSPYNPPGGGPPGFWPPGCCGPGAVVTRLGTSFAPRSFAIDKSQDPPRLVTWTGASDREAVADGIEDLQIAYACDMNGNGILEEGATPAARQTDEWAGNVGGDTPPSCQLPPGCVQPLCAPVPIAAVRITLIARTAGPFVGDLNGRRPGAGDNPGDAPPPAPSADLAATGGVGTYGRATLTATVKPRNIAGP